MKYTQNACFLAIKHAFYIKLAPMLVCKWWFTCRAAHGNEIRRLRIPQLRLDMAIRCEVLGLLKLSY